MKISKIFAIEMLSLCGADLVLFQPYFNNVHGFFLHFTNQNWFYFTIFPSLSIILTVYASILCNQAAK